MHTYVLMSKMAPQAPSVVAITTAMRDGKRSHRAWISQVREQCPEVEFLAHYALLGSWDFMDIYRAPDEESAARVSMICNAMGAFQTESLCAIPDDRLSEIADDVKRRLDARQADLAGPGS